MAPAVNAWAGSLVCGLSAQFRAPTAGVPARCHGCVCVFVCALHFDISLREWPPSRPLLSLSRAQRAGSRVQGVRALRAKTGKKGGTLGVETDVERLKTAGFMRELDTSGVKCDDLALAKFGDLRGVMAKRPLKPGSTFLSYPRHKISKVLCGGFTVRIPT